MDVKKYEALLYSLDLGSFSAAAEALRYTPAGISRMVDAVEASLGFAVLKRSFTGVCLTPSGEKIINEIRSIVKNEHMLCQHASELNGLVSGDITVGAYYSIATHWLPEVFIKFLHDYPNINIKLREGGHQLLNTWMSESDIDFCMYSFDPNIECKWFPLQKDRMAAVVAENHPFAKRKSVTLDECCKEPFIMPASGSDFDIMSILKQRTDKLNIRFSTVENYSALAMVESGLGISIMNELITKGLTRRIALVPLDPPQTISLGIAAPSMQAVSPAARKLIEYIKNTLCKKTVLPETNTV